MKFNRSAIKSKYISLPNGTSVLASKATPAQLKAAAIAHPGILDPQFIINGGKIVKKPGTQEVFKPGNPFNPANALQTDPFYQQDQAELDYNHKLAKNQYDSLMGVDGAHGSIWQDYDQAINQLTRDNRNNISQTNAGLSGSNLAGSGIARKSLSDIAAQFFADKSGLDTGRTRQETEATQNWVQENDRYGTQSGSLLGQAGERWKANNPGGWVDEQIKPTVKPGAPVKPPVKPAAPKPGARPPVGVVAPGTPAPVGRVHPPGMVFVKNPVTGKYTLRKK